MVATAFALVVLLGVCTSGAHGAATMLLQSGRVVDLDKMARDAKGKCCVSVYDVGLGSENSIMRMDGSGGKYYTTNDPNCGNVIYSSSYPVSFSYIYLCGQCKGGRPAVDGGKILVQQGGVCTKPDGSTDVYLVCVPTHPVCHQPVKGQPGKCSTWAESQAGSPPSSGGCSQFAALGQYCNVPNGQCCGGAPKNAKCENNKCVTTYPPTPAPTPAPAPTPTPGPVACASFANLGQDCNPSQGRCCGGAPKNAKCENGKCVTTYPTPGGPVGVTPLRK